jgi:hypothetical protein
MDERHSPQRDDPPLGVLLRGCLGIALALGGMALGGDWGQGLVVGGTFTTALNAVVFAVEAFARWWRAGKR